MGRGEGLQSSGNCRQGLPECGGSPVSRSMPQELLGSLAQVRGRPELRLDMRVAWYGWRRGLQRSPTPTPCGAAGYL